MVLIIRALPLPPRPAPTIIKLSAIKRCCWCATVGLPATAPNLNLGVQQCVLFLLFFIFLVSHTQVSPYFDPTYTRTGWIGQPPVLDRHEVVTDNGDVDTLRQATP